MAQPYAELGLTDDEYERICSILGRLPTATGARALLRHVERALSRKSSKVHLASSLRKRRRRVRSSLAWARTPVSSTSAGYAVTFKIESRNHPSFVEPYRVQQRVSAASCATS